MAEWDQLAGEPDEAYARFLIYRNLGPMRSIDAAYNLLATKRNKTRQASGQWNADSATYNWRTRAARWDVAQLSQVVPETAGLIFLAIKEYARIVLTEISSGKVKPQSWSEVKDALVTLSQFVSPEVITGAIDNAGDAGEETDS